MKKKIIKVIRFKENKKNLVLIKSGTFQMGNINGGIDEKPVHTITLESFIIGRYPVTQNEYEEIMGNNPSIFQVKRVIEQGSLGIARKVEKITAPMNPVENVTWYNAVEFCNRKSMKDGLTPCYSNSTGIEPICDFKASGYRLPTEAEWEYAAGSGSNSRTKWAGTNNERNLGNYAWYSPNSKTETHEVGTKKANSLGIYDMSGNVWEWCWDWEANYISGSLTNPKGPSSGSYRVLRGGSWSNRANICRVATRHKCGPDQSYQSHGFRVLRTP